MKHFSGNEVLMSHSIPGKTRACVLSAPTLVALNCGTVREAIDFLNNSYD